MTVFKKSNNASYDYKNNYNKDNFNKKVCSAMKKQNSKSALILDGKHMRSTSALLRMGIRLNNLTSIERNKKLHKIHLKNGIYSFAGDVWNVISKLNGYNPYDTLNLDAVSCCDTVSKHVENILKNNFLAKQSVLALLKDQNLEALILLMILINCKKQLNKKV